MSIAVKTQLENFIRRLGGPTIGFNCYRMFSPTHECYFNVSAQLMQLNQAINCVYRQIIMFMGSYFLLILDAPDIRRKYHV